MNEKCNGSYEHIGRTVVTREQIAEKIAETGRLISEEYAGKPLLFVGVLNGSFMFMADLCRAVTIPCEIAFMAAKSYSGTCSTGNVEITMDIAQDISRYHVILVEDIIDTGRTLSLIADMLRSRSPLSLKIVTLIDKPERRTVPFRADISLFTIPDLFIIGFGLDLDGYYRNLPYIAEYSAEDSHEQDIHS